MEIILLRDIEKVGEKHTIVTVKNGYGRNYLIPKGFAIIANDTNRQKLDAIRQKAAEEEAAKLAVVQGIADQLEGKVLKIGAKTGSSGKIFGSVTNIQLSQALQEQFSLEIDRRDIEITEEVKTVGTYVADLKLHKELEVKVNFEVVAE